MRTTRQARAERRYPRRLWLAGVLALMLGGASHADTADKLYERLEDRVYQIRLIDRSADSKSAIGSGFLVAESGVIATNYHVIRDKIRKPEKYRLEYLDAAEETGELEVIGLDVRHDLALVSGEVSADTPLTLRKDRPTKGVSIFPLGNPFDLGMTIVEGTHQGIDESLIYRWLLFSGAINSGMSGGPAVDAEGQVVGVSRAAGGEDIGFLVPAERLQALRERVAKRGYQPPDSFDAVIGRQLKGHQAKYMEKVLSGEWSTYELGPARVPVELAAFLDCTGESDSDNDEFYYEVQRGCGTSYEIKLSSGHETGDISYQATAYSSDKLGPQRFYNYYEHDFDPGYGIDGEEEEVTEFICRSRLVRASGTTWKTVFCARRYKRFEELYDAYMVLASVGAKDRGVIVKAGLRGVVRNNAERFAERLIDTVQWNSSSSKP